MNGAMRSSKHTRFFLPDPWTFSEKAYPAKLNDLLDLPRYLSKHYQHLSPWRCISKGLKLLKFVLTSGIGIQILKETSNLFKALAKMGNHHFIFILYFDLISTLLFSQYHQKSKPRCAILFLNSLAHIQHHYWKDGPKGVTPQILYGLQVIDRILAHLFKTLPECAFVIHNGLSQMNTNHETPWVLYRQKDPKQFLKAMGFKPLKVEQHMTHDGHAFFDSEQSCLNAFNALNAATIYGQKLFHAELNAHDKTKLFYMLQFTENTITNTTTFTLNAKQYLFLKYFAKIVTRTGRHTPIGTVLSDTLVFPDQIFNHDFNQYLFHYLSPRRFPLKNLEADVYQEVQEEEYA
jgi:hypothetical protein